MHERHRDAPGWADRLMWVAAGFLTLATGAALAMSESGGGSSAAVLAWGVAVGGLGAWALGRSRERERERTSRELTFLSERLIAVESLLADMDRRPVAAVPIAPDLAGDVALLGSLVGDLAETLAAHDADISGLKAAPRDTESPMASAPRVEPFGAPLGGPDAGPAAAAPPTSPTPWLMPNLAELARPAHAPEHDGTKALLEALEAGRVELLTQTVVTLPQRRAAGAELLARLRLGAADLVGPDRFLPAFEANGVLGRLDRLVLARAAPLLRSPAAGWLSLSLSDGALRDPALLDDILRADRESALSGKLVLEIAQRGWLRPEPEERAVRDLIRDRGIAFALRRVTDLRLDPAALAAEGVSLVKVAAELLLLPGQEEAVAALVADLSARDIRLVATGVERERVVPELIDLGVSLAQGSLFGRPASPLPAEPPAVAPPAPEPIRTGPDPVSGSAPRGVSLKEFLRRGG